MRIVVLCLFLFMVLLSFTFSSPAFAGCIAEGQFAKLCNITVNDNTTLVRDIIQILLVLAGVATLFFLIWGGVKWILSGGDKAKITEARGMITAAVVGLIVTFLSFFIISMVNVLFGLRGGTIFVMPRLTNEKPLPPTDVNNVAPDCTGSGPC